MFRPPHDPRYRRTVDEPTWRGIIASYALAAAIPLLLWIASQPLAGAVVLATIVGLLAGARRVPRLARCLYDCRGIAFDLGRDVKITVTWTTTDDPC